MSAFIDTNVLVYAQGTGAKSETARQVVLDGGVISVQVLNEFAAVLRRKFRLEWDVIADALADVRTALGPARATLRAAWKREADEPHRLVARGGSAAHESGEPPAERAFTLSPPADRSVVLVSEAAFGTIGFDEWLGRFHRQVVRPPIRRTYHPNARFLAWNAREVFQAPERP